MDLCLLSASLPKCLFQSYREQYGYDGELACFLAYGRAKEAELLRTLKHIGQMQMPPAAPASLWPWI
jgi:hypothetical protein